MESANSKAIPGVKVKGALMGVLDQAADGMWSQLSKLQVPRLSLSLSLPPLLLLLISKMSALLN